MVWRSENRRGLQECLGVIEKIIRKYFINILKVRGVASPIRAQRGNLSVEPKNACEVLN